MYRDYHQVELIVIKTALNLPALRKHSLSQRLERGHHHTRDIACPYGDVLWLFYHLFCDLFYSDFWFVFWCLLSEQVYYDSIVMRNAKRKKRSLSVM